MPIGDTLTRSQLDRLRGAQRDAEFVSGLTFSVFVGVSEEDSRAYAERLHSALEDPDHAVLVLCDPEFRTLDIVTGRAARRVLADFECRLAAASMRSSFVGGDIVGGLAHGVRQLGESARRPRTLHTERWN